MKFEIPLLTKPKGILLGRSQTFPYSSQYLTDAQINHHVHIVGASGYGKTVLLSHIVENRIRNGKGLLFIDQKGDLETITGFRRYVSESNRENDLKIFSLGQFDESGSYNLLSNGSATELRDRVMSSLVWSEEFYQHQAAGFLLRLFSGLVWLRDNVQLKLDIAAVVHALNSPKRMDELFAKIPMSAGKPWELFDQARLFIKSPDLSKTIQGLRTQLESIAYSDFAEKVESKDDGIDLFRAVRDSKIVFMFLDTRRFGTTATAVGRFIIQDLKAVSAKIDSEIPKSERKPFTVIVDEFSDLAQEDFIGFLDRARSSKMGIIVAHQEISDLNRISPEFCGRLMGNTATLFSFLQKRPESAELISGVAGTRTVWKSTKATDRILGIEIDTGKRSKREVEEFNIHPNVVKSLGVGRCIRISKYPNATSSIIRVRH